MTKPTFKQSWMPVLLAAMTAATAYLGNNVYQTSQEPTTVNVNVDSMPAGISHDHRTTESIQALIDRAVKASMHEHVKESGRH